VMLMLCCCSECYLVRSAFIRVCYSAFALHCSFTTSYGEHHRLFAHRHGSHEQHRDSREDVHAGDMEMKEEHHRFVNLVHREVRAQLTEFLSGSSNISMMCQPYVVTYYTDLTNVVLRDCLTCTEDLIPLLTRCLCSAVYEIRLAGLQFLASFLGGNNHWRITSVTPDDDDDDDDDDDNDDTDFNYCLPAISSVSTDDCKRKILCELMMIDNCDLLRKLVDNLLYTEIHDECLIMVSAS